MKSAAGAPVYLGLFLITFATMIYELLLTRIFSVTLFYHFAFMAVSLAMFGMTAGAGFVNTLSKIVTDENKQVMLTIAGLLFAVTILVTFWAQVTIPWTVQFSSGLTIATTFLTLGVPFFFSGVVVCLCLTRFPGQVGKLYAADLVGAAAGCLALVALLDQVDAPTAVVWVSAFSAAGAFLFSWGKDKKWSTVAAVLMVGLSALALANPSQRFVKLTWSKGDENVVPLYEKWNSFSRVRVFGNPEVPQQLEGWGVSQRMPKDLKVRQLQLDIDSFASTMLTKFDGNLFDLSAVKYHITNVGHFIRPNAAVLVIGAGGGRDIISSLFFKQKSVLAVEINPNIINAVNNVFGDFTGHLNRIPNVSFVNDEARSFLSRLDAKERFDIIQLSLVDTFAASSAGAFALTENMLYTREAWDIFMDHLTDRGILSVSRWYSNRRPGEIYRILTLASQALRDHGIQDVRRHLMLVRLATAELDSKTPNQTGVGTLLVSRTPFTDADVSTMEKVAEEMHFDLMLSPRHVSEPILGQLTSPAEADKLIQSFPIRIDPPTDDSPFFFQMLRPKDWLLLDAIDRDRMLAAYSTAMFNLGILAVLVAMLTSIFTVSPFFLRTFRPLAFKAVDLLIYFGAIGLGFILIEIALIQRFQLLLGIPVLSLSVSLFTLLISSAAGSYVVESFETKNTGSGKYFLLLLLVVLVGLGVAHPAIIEHCLALSSLLRILVVVASIAPLGFLMGCCFPLGMREAVKRVPEIAPWLWGLNGSMSVVGSVLSIFIALAAGITAAYWTGALAYFFAVACYFIAARQGRQTTVEPLAD